MGVRCRCGEPRHAVALIQENGRPDEVPHERGIFLWACFRCKNYLACRPRWS